MNRLLAGLGSGLAAWLGRPRPQLAAPRVAGGEPWIEVLEPGDVVLVEGSSRIATGIRYLTQSTWSHAALAVGPDPARGVQMLVEADLREGVRSIAAAHYATSNVRLCRPVGLDAGERHAILTHVLAAVGHRYDLRNVVDLARWLLPTPPVPARLRRDLLALGSGEPTRAICSTLIAEAFQQVGYPILPRAVEHGDDGPRFRPRHHSFTTPRDFDLSPFFAVIKPTLAVGFDHRAFAWAGDG